MDHSHHTRLKSDELTPETLKDAAIYGADGLEMGRVPACMAAVRPAR